MRKFLVFIFIVMIAIAGGGYFYGLPKAERTITKTIENIGFNTVQIGQISYTPSTITIDQIQLDNDGFNNLQNIEMEISWPDFLLKNTIEKITVGQVNHSSTLNTLRLASRQFQKFDWSQINNAPAENIIIKSIIWDIAAGQKALRFEASATIYKTDDKSLIKGALKAVQNDLTFISQWSGMIGEKSQEFNGVFENLKIVHPAFRMNRGNGWVSYALNNGEVDFSAQFDGGSGLLFDLPVNNINIIGDRDEQGYPIIFRADAAGIDGVHLTSDFLYAHQVDQRSFNSTLEIQNLGQFTGYLKEQNLIPDISDLDIKGLESTKTYLTYMPERRFPNGPLPFDIYTQNESKKVLEGTFLIYPSSYDLRGTIEGDKNVTPVMVDLLSIPEAYVTDNVIRLEGNIATLIK